MDDKIVEAPKKHLDSLKESLLRIPKNYVPFLIILIALPVSVVLALTAQELRSHAGGGALGSINVSPGSINVKVGDKVPMSALAYDTNQNPIFGGVNYDWSMSSSHTVGTLTQTQGNISEFDALHSGCGEITVTGTWAGTTITKPVDIVVADVNNTPDCGTNSVTPTPSISYHLDGVDVTDYQPNLSINPGEKAKLMTITSTGALSVSMIGYPTSYGAGINYLPQSFGLGKGYSIDIYVQVNSDTPVGHYSGAPVIRTDTSSEDQSIPTNDNIYVGTPILTPTPVVSPTPEPTYTLVPSQKGITMPVSQQNETYGVYATLHDSSGNIVTDQSNFNYDWSVADNSVVGVSPFATCTQGIQPPCPTDHAMLKAYKAGQTLIEVYVTRKDTNQGVADVLIPVQVNPSLSQAKLTPTDDSYVNGTSNHGKSAQIIVDGNPTSYGYLKFDLSSLKGKKLQSAVLSLTVSGTLGAGSKGNFRISSTTTNWKESTVNITNAPTFGPQITLFSNPKINSSISVPLTSFLTSKMGSVVSLSLSTLSSDNLILNSKEAATGRPQLLIQYQN